MYVCLYLVMKVYIDVKSFNPCCVSIKDILHQHGAMKTTLLLPNTQQAGRLSKLRYKENSKGETKGDTEGGNRGW